MTPLDTSPTEENPVSGSGAITPADATLARRDIPAKDRDIVRRLAEEYAEIAASPRQKETAERWRRLNDLETGHRPLVWINEICWHEMNWQDELTCLCEDPFCRGVEWGLRSDLYQWRHLPVDMVLEPRFYSGLAIHDTGFGIHEDVKVIHTDPRSGVVSREFHPQIREEKDIEKIQMPVLSHNEEASRITLHTMTELVGDILPVHQVGVVHQWFAPWDELIRWWGVQDAMMDLALRPELVHAAMDRLVSAYCARLDQWEQLNLLSWTEGNYRVGSGGLAYVSDLPGKDYDPRRVHLRNQWGCATAQIFSEVSPAMHEEFALRYERRWLDRFGLTYYGCCEPLHIKLGILESVKNLRKISMSPWADIEKAAAITQGRLVLSHKPNPAVLATDVWHPEQARKNLREVLEKVRGLPVEVILKDISTVRYEPQRLWDWARIAMEVVEEMG